MCSVRRSMFCISYCDVKQCAKYKIKWHQESIIYKVTYLNSYFFSKQRGILLCFDICYFEVFSSPEPKAQGELIVYQSSRRVSVCVSVDIFKLEYLCNQWANRNKILTEPSLGWGKGCIRFWARSDRNSGVHGNR